MPKAILAIRTYPATLLLALLLFVATLVMTAASMGTAGGGGGNDGDGGSGIGGTGKSGEFGGSGFGGTGSPSPFVTSIDDQEQPAQQQPSVEIADIVPPAEKSTIASVPPEATAVLPAPAQTDLTQDLSDSIEQNLLVRETSDAFVSNDIQEIVETTASLPEVPEETPATVQLAEAPSLAPVPAQSFPELTKSDNTLEIAVGPLATEPSPETIAVKLETAAEDGKQEVDRTNLPDRIQRPDLPPFQRVRPVDRASIMAPVRVQPMRI
ncbi:MAG: hypothetical protein V4751_01095 [Pseudomonadota bacterium]